MADETVTTTGTETTTPTAETTSPGGTGDPAGGGAKKVSIDQHEYDVLRDTRVREKALEVEVQRLRTEAEARANPTTDTRVDTADMSPAEIKAYKADLRAAWDGGKGSRDAGAVLASIISSEKASADNRQLLFEIQLERIPEADRDAVKKHMKETGAPTPQISYDLLRGPKAAALEQENAELKRQLADAKKPKPKPEGTRIAGLPAGDVADDGVPAIGLGEYNERMAKDPNKTIAERRAGKFRLKDS